jgi:hypothetical protein
MTIEADLFKRYTNEYPEFRRLLIMRATTRRGFINFKMKLSSYETFLKQKMAKYAELDPNSE